MSARPDASGSQRPLPIRTERIRTERRNLVYTSAGDQSSLAHWLAGRRNFDLWVTYYGDHPKRYEAVADGWWARKGSKFNNFHDLWRSTPGILQRYDAVMVLDDDILIDADAISRLFDLREQYALTILQPAFVGDSKLSHPITACQPDYLMRFTRFVEMNCPLFRREGLEAFLAEYDPELVGFGIDHWYMSVLARDPECRCAIVDSIPCVNPPDEWKGGVREIDRIQPDAERRATWERIQRARGIPEADTVHDLGGIKLPLRKRVFTRLTSMLRPGDAGSKTAQA